MPDPRNNPGDAYTAFMSMPDSEWEGLLRSLLSGGVLTPAEQQGFDRALVERSQAQMELEMTVLDLKHLLQQTNLSPAQIDQCLRAAWHEHSKTRQMM